MGIKKITINSDAARIKFSTTCLRQNENDASKGTTVLPGHISDPLSERLAKFQELKQSRGKEAADTKPAVAEKDAAKTTCRKFSSHFFQVINFAIDRCLETGTKGFDEGSLKHYGTELTRGTTPALYTDENVAYWGKNIIEGEKKRVEAGGTPMANPSAAEVEVQYNNFAEKLQIVQKEKGELDEAEEALDRMRPEMDEAIDEAIDYLEYYYRKEPAPSLRRKLRTYGVRYASDKGEEFMDDDEQDEAL